MLVCGVGGAGGVGGEGGDHLSTDIQWIQFLKTLKEKDYFQVCDYIVYCAACDLML